MDLKNQWQAETLISQRGNSAKAEDPSKKQDYITLHMSVSYKILCRTTKDYDFNHKVF